MHHDGSYISRDGSNLTFILNPRSRNYSPVFKDLAAAKWPESKFFESSDEDELFDFGKRTVEGPREQPPVVVACGGDGTFRAVATAVEGGAILGIVPMGTVNLVAYQLGIPKDMKSALEVLGKGRVDRIYPGCCSWGETGIRRLFFISVSMGTDADAVHYVSGILKALFGKTAYAFSFLSRLLFHGLPKVAYILDGHKHACNGMIVVSSGFYGGRNIISARQRLHKPGIEIISLGHGRKNILGFFIALFTGIGKCSDFASSTTGTHLEMSCRPHGRFQIDGDKLSASKISIRSSDTPLTVITNRPGTDPD